MPQETPTPRPAARVLMLDGDRRRLLARFVHGGRSWWAAPGGGLEEGETHEGAARREIAEETGFGLENLGPWVWSREHVFRFGGRLYRQQERYFLAHVPAFERRPKVLGAEEARFFSELRWWTLAELEGTTEAFAPADLPVLVLRLVEEGPPNRPVAVGV